MTYAGQIYRCGDDDASLRLRQRPHVVAQGQTVHESPQSPLPRLEHDRWIVDCECGSGAGISNAGKAYCFECGAIMTIAAFPSKPDRDAVATLMASRPATTRNWHPERESVKDLQDENARHRV